VPMARMERVGLAFSEFIAVWRESRSRVVMGRSILERLVAAEGEERW
jgi:hypothetical protein